MVKRLIIAPHADDEVLGCASVLDAETFVYYVGIDEFHEVSREDRLREVEATARYFGFRYGWCADNVVNQYRLIDLIPTFERLINEHRPEELFLPFGEGYNQDHRTVFQAGLVASRPHDRNWFVPRVFVYEETDMLWSPSAFQPQFFVPLDLGAKLAGVQLQPSQCRGHRALDLLAAVARVRGQQAGVAHAEAFQVLRFVGAGGGHVARG